MNTQNGYSANQVNSQQVAPQAPYQGVSPQQAVSTSGLAITGLILGILAIVASPIPIVNNVAIVPAILGFIFGIIAMFGISKGKKKGKGLAISGIVLSVIAFAIVLVSQQAYSEAFDKALSGSSVTSTSSTPATPTSTDSASSAPAANNAQQAKSGQDLAVGASATFDNGLTITVNSVDANLQNYNNAPITGINVTYVNNGNKEESFNPYDWKAQDPNGAQRNTTIYTGDTNAAASSGTLAPGGTVTFNMYFDGPITKALYYSNSLFSKEPSASWNL